MVTTEEEKKRLMELMIAKVEQTKRITTFWCLLAMFFFVCNIAILSGIAVVLYK